MIEPVVESGQISVSLAAQAQEMKSILEPVVSIAEHLHRDFSLEFPADHVAMSFRNSKSSYQRQECPPALVTSAMRVEARGRMME